MSKTEYILILPNDSVATRHTICTVARRRVGSYVYETMSTTTYGQGVQLIKDLNGADDGQD